jgi:hypothetical protein
VAHVGVLKALEKNEININDFFVMYLAIEYKSLFEQLYCYLRKKEITTMNYVWTIACFGKKLIIQ